MSSTNSNHGAGEHVLVLATLLPAADSRVWRQIGSLVNAGNQVSLVAVTDESQLEQDYDTTDSWDFETPARDKRKDPFPDCPGAGDRVYKSLHDHIRLFDRSTADRAYIRSALRLQRMIGSLHWSREVRRERQEKHRAFRDRMRNLVDKDDNSRLARYATTISWYEFGLQGYVNESKELARRIAELGAPRVIQVHEAFALTSGIFLARRWGARLVYDAIEYAHEGSQLVPDVKKSYFTLLKDDELAGRAIHDVLNEQLGQSEEARDHGY